MATIDEAFAVLLGRLELNPTRIALASQRYNAIKDVVETNLTGATIRQIGSFQRKTKIRPQDLSEGLDVDALAIIGEARQYAPPGQGLSPEQALESVRRALRNDKTYRVMDPVSDAPVVSLDYSDGFKMEIAVGYRELTGKFPRSGGPAAYIVAGCKEWRPADYDYDALLISTANQQCAGNLVPMIKLIKQWTRNHEVPLKSFHLEILAAHTLPAAWADWKQRNQTGGYSHSLAAFLERAGGLLARPTALPGSYSPPADSGMSGDDGIRLARYLDDRAKVAWRLCAETRVDRAIVGWQEFFGEPFPPMSGVA